MERVAGDVVHAWWFAHTFGRRDRKVIWRNILIQFKLQPNGSLHLASYYSDVCMIERKLGLDVDDTIGTGIYL